CGRRGRPSRAGAPGRSGAAADRASRGMRLSVPPLAELEARRGEKWSSQPPGVLSMTVAEMDFAPAPAVAAAVRDAVERGDLGYAPGADGRLAGAFAAFARRRMDWEVDPEQVTLVPDVVAGTLELCRALLRPGDGVALATPAYP